MLRQSHANARRLISGVRPPILDEEGIVAALAHLVSDHRGQKAPPIELLSEVAFDRLVPILENALYRIAQEALTNACQHSKSERIRVEMVQQDDYLRIVVQDWGIGFDPDEVGEVTALTWPACGSGHGCCGGQHQRGKGRTERGDSDHGGVAAGGEEFEFVCRNRQSPPNRHNPPILVSLVRGSRAWYDNCVGSPRHYSLHRRGGVVP